MRYCRFMSCLILCLQSYTVSSFAESPNIVFIYTDDQAPSAVGFAGNSELKTPHIDRIAEEGAILENAFTVTPVCSPSRAGMATSRYASELGILDWINPSSEPEVGLNPNTITWMELLQQAGYATCLSGKWHLGTADRFHPTLQGYDEFMGIRTGGCPPKNPILEVNGHDTKTQGFTVDLVTDHAIEFIKASKNKPFAVSIHYREPHAAWLPTREEDWRPYKDLDPTLPQPLHPDLDQPRVKKMLREYYASIASVDRNVGRILSLLDELQLTDNTVVIFTSDHGYNNGHHGVWFKGNAIFMLKPKPPQVWDKINASRRPNLWDQSLRVPTAIRWPQSIQPGSRISNTVSNLDWYPTLLAMCGIEPPNDLTLRGRDCTPILRGEKVDWDNDLYCEYSMRHGSTTDMRGWRTSEWKLMIDFANPGRGELYHLASDSHETTNLFDSKDAQHQKVRQQLTAKIMSKLREIQDPLLLDLPAAE